MSFTEQEKKTNIRSFHHNRRTSRREYLRLYPNSRLPNEHSFKFIYDSVNRTISFNRKKRTYALNEDDNRELNMLLYFQEHPESSIRKASEHLELSYWKLQSTLTKYKFKLYPYKFTKVQFLSDNNKQARAQFCQEILQRLNENSRLFENILWSDECSFSTAGIFNRKNTHFWSSMNPHLTKPIQFSGRRSINVWCGILWGKIIGPFCIQNSLTGRGYQELLENILGQLPQIFPNKNLDEIIWQQDGAPPHNVADVQNVLNTQFPEWIGRFGTIRWPPYSPDLTPLDTFLWGALKDKVYAFNNLNINDIENVIRQEIIIINNYGQASIYGALEKLKWGYRRYLEENGGHYEHLHRQYPN